MPITTIWHVLHQEEDSVNFSLPYGTKGYVFNGIDQLLAPYSADELGDQVVRVPLLNATRNTIEERTHAGGDRLTARNWFGFNIVDGIMNLVTWYDTDEILVRYGMFYTDRQVIPQFRSMIREPAQPFEWTTISRSRRISRYDRPWVI